ncbi:hypothetical protein QTN25_006195 [Entamoeba marina]
MMTPIQCCIDDVDNKLVDLKASIAELKETEMWYFLVAEVNGIDVFLKLFEERKDRKLWCRRCYFTLFYVTENFGRIKERFNSP